MPADFDQLAETAHAFQDALKRMKEAAQEAVPLAQQLAVEVAEIEPICQREMPSGKTTGEAVLDCARSVEASAQGLTAAAAVCHSVLTLAERLAQQE